MGARRTDMHRLQEVVRLHRLGTSTRTIARQLRMGRDTIRTLLDALEKVGQFDGELSTLPKLDVLRALVEEHTPSKPARQQTSSVDRWQVRVEKLRERGAGPTAIHDHLRLQEPDYEGSLSSIKRLCARLNRACGLPRLSSCTTRAATIIRQRRSAVAFDAATSITADQFYEMLDALIPRPGVAPWDTLPWSPK